MWIFSAMNLPLIAVDPRTQVPQPRERYPQVIHSAPWSSMTHHTRFFVNTAKRPVVWHMRVH